MNEQVNQPPPTPRRVSKRVLLFLVVGAVIGGTFWKNGVSGMFSSSETREQSVEVSIPQDVQMASGEKTDDSDTTETSVQPADNQILGTWTFSDSDASRVIVNREDGTATIDVTFGFVASFLYGSKLQLELEWTLEDDVLTHIIVGGSPEGGKKALVRDYGEKTIYKILNLTNKEMNLKETSGEEEEYLWKRAVDK